MKMKILDIIRRVHEIFIEKGLTLSVAESCTGGLISHYMTTLPGASRFFEAGAVTYSAASKKVILGVSSSTISTHGVVSRETAKEMSEKMRSLAGTDYAVATTGNLGPDILEGKPKGLVYISLSKNGKTLIKELRLEGERDENKEEAAVAAMNFLIEVINKAE